MSDIDLRIRPEEVARATALGRQRGWRVAHTSKIYPIVSFDVAGVRVEIEGAVGPPGLCALRVDQMLSRSIETDALGFPCRFPEVHDHALHLVVNVFKDKITDAAAWALNDVERIVRQSEFVPETFVSLARASRSQTMAWIVADYFANRRNDAVWRDLRNQLGAPESPAFVRMLRYFVERAPTSFGARIAARAGADSNRLRAKAFALTALRSAEMFAKRRA